MSSPKTLPNHATKHVKSTPGGLVKPETHVPPSQNTPIHVHVTSKASPKGGINGLLVALGPSFDPPLEAIGLGGGSWGRR